MAGIDWLVEAPTVSHLATALNRTLRIVDLLAAIVLMLPNVLVVGVWVFAVCQEGLPVTRESVPVVAQTICGGGMLSFVGLVVAMSRLLFYIDPPSRPPVWWLGCLVANMAGATINFLGFAAYFVFYLAPGC